VYGRDIDLDNWYTGAALGLSYFCLPARVDVMLTNEHWDWFLAIIYFLPELLAAALGGLLAASLFRVSQGRLSESAVSALADDACQYVAADPALRGGLWYHPIRPFSALTRVPLGRPSVLRREP